MWMFSPGMNVMVGTRVSMWLMFPSQCCAPLGSSASCRCTANQWTGRYAHSPEVMAGTISSFLPSVLQPASRIVTETFILSLLQSCSEFEQEPWCDYLILVTCQIVRVFPWSKSCHPSLLPKPQTMSRPSRWPGSPRLLKRLQSWLEKYNQSSKRCSHLTWTELTRSSLSHRMLQNNVQIFLKDDQHLTNDQRSEKMGQTRIQKILHS